MKVGILAAGTSPVELQNDFGSDADMVMNLFNSVQTRFEYKTYDVRDGIFPSSADECDGWVITGSDFSVYDNLPWMELLKALILEIVTLKRPLIGICFGHQIIADALGGRVEKYHGGWAAGLYSYELTQQRDFMRSAPSSFTLCAMHQDQVTTLPDNAYVFATSDFCQYAGLIYDDQVLTLQAHPEYTAMYESELIEVLKNTQVLPAVVAEYGINGIRDYGSSVNSDMVASWLVNFMLERA